MKVNGILRYTDFDCSLEVGFVYAPKKVMYACTSIDHSISVVLEVLHLLKNLLVISNINLEVVALESPLYLREQNSSLSCPAWC